MSEITTIGLDLAKNIFQLHAIDASGFVVEKRSLRRSQMISYFEKLSPCLIGMEACASSHYWGRLLQIFGHEVRLMPAQYVKAYVKRNKTDARDAAAICEAVTRPTMRFVPIKSEEDQALNVILKSRDLLVRQKTQTINALRAHLAEFGIVAAAGMAGVTSLLQIIYDETNGRLSRLVRLSLKQMADHIELLTDKIIKLEKEIHKQIKTDTEALRLMSIPGIGPMTAAAIRASVPDAAGFRTGRDFSAWIGLTPRVSASGGKERLGSITKQGNKSLRTLLVAGAACVLKLARRGLKIPHSINSLLQHRPFKVAAVALANKMARIVWALLVKGGLYQPSQMMGAENN